MVKRIALAACFCSSLFNCAQALEFHFGTGAGIFQADDPELKSGNALSGFLLSGVSYSINRNAAIVSELQYSAFKSDAEPHQMGLQAKALDWSIAYSHQYPFSYRFQPHFSLGGFVSQFSLKQRHQVDDAGFLTQQFDNHSAVTGGIAFSVHHRFSIERFDSEWGVGLQMKYAFSGINSIGVFALYRF